ncbi:hydrogenase 4 membrane subunit [Sulfurospirillum deleyianum]|uniref:NADH-ubiquinone oxidoreductase chain 4L n=1 Tax=Sulfurospirillum deleyianum (strain ATCC 51133 / DSM 6946 / 5175) TaxID=525898 RepID=D1B459_SULD5|nr:hydrogenase 4 membrane subunit [Sulfurospirillum deleyianum]ACZ12879.1 NADH-ubiquinone oxidoreductase chain 4L [Sulfurospirillum deleyianum DSM 6946]
METLINSLTVLMMGTSFAVFSLRQYRHSIQAYALQTLLLVLVFLLLHVKYDAHELLIWAGTAFVMKVILVPLFLLRVVKKLGVVVEDEPVGGFFISPVIALSFSLAVAMMFYKVFIHFSLIQDTLPLFAAPFIFMMGIFGFILRNSFIKQILAYCLFENGIHLSLALMAYNAHELVEVGILTDAIFAVLIMGILAKRFYATYESLDTSKAVNLKG